MASTHEVRFRVTVADDLPNGVTADEAVDSLRAEMGSAAIRWRLGRRSWLIGPVVELKDDRGARAGIDSVLAAHVANFDYDGCLCGNEQTGEPAWRAHLAEQLDKAMIPREYGEG